MDSWKSVDEKNFLPQKRIKERPKFLERLILEKYYRRINRKIKLYNIKGVRTE